MDYQFSRNPEPGRLELDNTALQKFRVVTMDANYLEVRYDLQAERLVLSHSGEGEITGPEFLEHLTRIMKEQAENQQFNGIRYQYK